jgi:hypothetical protein
MPATIHCPLCQGSLALDDAALGKRVRCPLCKGVFLAEAVLDVLPVVEEAEPAPPPKPTKAPSPPPEEPPRPSVWETLDEKPQKRRRRRRDDEDGDEDDGRRDLMPHNGHMLHTLGILCLCLSCIALVAVPLAIATIVMATNDLKAMRRGDMDPRGRIRTEQAKARAVGGLVLSFLLIATGCLVRAAFRF